MECGTRAPCTFHKAPFNPADRQRSHDHTALQGARGRLESLALTLACSSWYKLSKGRKEVRTPRLESAQEELKNKKTTKPSIVLLQTPPWCSGALGRKSKSLLRAHQVQYEQPADLFSLSLCSGHTSLCSTTPQDLGRLFFLPNISGQVPVYHSSAGLQVTSLEEPSRTLPNSPQTLGRPPPPALLFSKHFALSLESLITS